MQNLLRIPLYFGLFLVATLSIAQSETNFSQYMHSEGLINPAYSGSKDALSASILHRSQWVNFEGAPVTIALNAHAPILNNMGVGLSVVKDKIGASDELSVTAAYAYRIQLGGGNFSKKRKRSRLSGGKKMLSFGLQAGFDRYMESYGDLTLIDANDPQFNGQQNKVLLPHFGFGTMYNTKKYMIGLTIPRLVTNTVNYEDAAATVRSKLLHMQQTHFFLYGTYLFPVAEDLIIKPTVLFKNVYGAPLQFDLNGSVLIKQTFWAGLGYRSGAAFTAHAGFIYNSRYSITYSYDLTTTDIKTYSNGSHEIRLSMALPMNDQFKASFTPRFF